MEAEALMSEQSLLLHLLLDKGLLAEEDLAEAQKAIIDHNGPPEEALAEASIVGDIDIARAYADDFNLPIVGVDEPLRVSKELTELVGENICREGLLMPLLRDDDTLEVAFVNPTDLTMLERIQLLTGLVIRPVVAPVMRITEAIAEILGSRDFVKEIASEAASRPQSEEEDDAIEEVIDLDRAVPKGRDSQVVRLVNHVLSSAVKNEASDIHLETFENNVKIRVRIDGQLHEISPPPKPMYIPIISRLKVLSKMDIAERRVPQDGAIALIVAEKRVDLRVSTVPTVYGEKMVLRILSKGAIPTKLTELGFGEKQSDDFIAALQMPHGLILVTGPTGSGKSTTLYTALNIINQPKVNIMTVEDPVEYKFEGLNQVHVRSQVGLTFASALRAFLRQDPDIIMVGEVRDQETAQICLRAALTGHMVLSTLHTNDALAAINRLVDMGVEPFLLGSALRLVQAQRLVRRLCTECKELYKPDPETIQRWRLDPDGEYYRPTGCDACRDTGYKGRVGLFEVVTITPKLRDMIAERRGLPELRQQARKQGMMLLADAGMVKVKEGLTSLEEALSVCMSETEEE